MNIESKIYVAGASGMVGSAIVRNLKENGYTNLVTDRVDLTNQQCTIDFFKLNKPGYVFMAAGKVGGIATNNLDRADFIYNNTMMAANVVYAAHRVGVKKLLFIGSSCMYPKNSVQPIKEEYLLSSELEPTNEPYAIAKITGIKLCESFNRQYRDNFISAIPCNSYGENDNYNYQTSHVMASIIRNVIEAKKNNRKEIELWGTGKPRREFIFVDDMADGLIYLMKNYEGVEPINIGTGQDISIKGLAELVKEIVGWDGEIKFNQVMDGMMEKRMDVSKINNLGWRARTTLMEGINKTISNLKYDWI